VLDGLRHPVVRVPIRGGRPRRLSLASLSRFGHRGDRPPRCRIAFGGTGVVLASRRWRW
jgi:hypothetical protein